MSKFGFTLIELLVVIAIIAIIGTFAIANYRSFGQDKELESAALDIQSLIRVAQTNATTGKKCIPRNNPNTSFPAEVWSNDFFRQEDGDKITLACAYINEVGSLVGGFWGVQKYIILPAHIKLVSADIDSCPNVLNNLFNEHTGHGSFAGVEFKLPLGNLTSHSYFVGSIDFNQGCPDGNTFRVNLKNTKTNFTKQIIIDKGGRVYVQ